MHTQEKKKSFQDIINSDTPTLVDFFATWCGPCIAMSPIIKQLKSEMGDKVNILKVDVDQNPQAAMAFQIYGVPTLIMFKNGEPVWRQSGVQSLQQLKAVVNAHS